MNGQIENYYEAQQLVRMLEAVINQHKVFGDRKLFHWDSVYKTAEYHHVTNMAYYAILGMDVKLPPESREKFEKRFRQAVASEEVLENVVEAVCWQFERSARHILPGAGYACRTYYGRKDMSECQEAEFLVEKECRGLLQELMLQMNFEFQKSSQDRISYVRNGIRLIFREKWGDSSRRVQKFFKGKPSDFPLKKGFRYVHEMSPEELYLRQICDLAESFVSEYPRMRMLMNFWLFYLGHSGQLNYRLISRNLKRMRLDEFAQRILNLAALWFGRIQMEEADYAGQELAVYMLSGGREGAEAVRRLLPYKCELEEEEIIRTRKEGAEKKWSFPSRSYMQILYPSLAAFPFLLPIFWLARLCRLGHYRFRNRRRRKEIAQSVEKNT